MTTSRKSETLGRPIPPTLDSFLPCPLTYQLNGRFYMYDSFVSCVVISLFGACELLSHPPVSWREAAQAEGPYIRTCSRAVANFFLITSPSHLFPPYLAASNNFLRRSNIFTSRQVLLNYKLSQDFTFAILVDNNARCLSRRVRTPHFR